MSTEIKFEDEIYQRPVKTSSTPIIDFTYKCTFGFIQTEKQAVRFLSLLIVICGLVTAYYIKQTFFPPPPEIIRPVDARIL